jgi:rare lipoprotein A
VDVFIRFFYYIGLIFFACSFGCHDAHFSEEPYCDRTSQPYTINNITYVPDKDYRTIAPQIVVASHYGKNDGFHGKKTASGRIFHQELLTGAHKTLPLPCMVEVTDLKTKKIIHVLINDRGPFKKGRDLDLSSGAAQKLGDDFLKHGIGIVKIRVLVRETSLLLEKIKMNKKK